jgi:streptogramin lyase
MKYYYINGSTGAILKTVDVSPWNHNAYGAVMDKNGVLWSSDNPGWEDIWLDPSTDPPTIGTWNPGHFVYGVGVDYLGHLFATGWDSSLLSRINITTRTVDWTKPGAYGSRGVVATSDNNIWTADSMSNTVTRFDNNGSVLATISGVNHPTGVAVDADGKVWVCDLGDEYIHRIDPATNTIDLSKQIIGSGGHYTYSDMTGIIARTITTKIGTWTVISDSGASDTPWGTISWNSYEPAGTSITVKVRSSNDEVNWSAWETATNGIPLTTTPSGRYLQTEVTFQIFSGEDIPILYDLTVCTKIAYEAEFVLYLKSGWNLISFPVYMSNPEVGDIFSGLPYYIVYEWDPVGNRYVRVTGDAEPSKGYWVFVTKDANINISGTPVYEYTRNLTAGWNLIGSIATETYIWDPDDEPDNSVWNKVYTWLPGGYIYIKTQNIDPCKGYWVLAYNDCNLTVAPAPPIPPYPPLPPFP